MAVDCEAHDIAVIEAGRLQKRVAELEAVLGVAYGHILSGSATVQSRFWLLTQIRETLRWPDVEADVSRRIKDLQNWMNT